MRSTRLMIAFLCILSLLLLPACGLATLAQDLSISVQWTDESGAVRVSDPALPLTENPYEYRFWITLPPDAPLQGLTLNIADLSGELASFVPGQGNVLENVQDAQGTLDFPPIQIQGMSAGGMPYAAYSLYLSYVPLPQFVPTEPPATTAEVVIHFVDETGAPLQADETLTLEMGEHPIDAPAIDGYTPAGESTAWVMVGPGMVWPAEVTFTYAPVIPPAPVTGQVLVHYVDENGNPLQSDVTYTVDEGQHAISAPAIDGYTPAGTGVFSVTVDENGAWPAEVTFTYTRVIPPAPVTVHAVDANGHALLPDRVETVSPDSPFVTAQPIEGYTLAGQETVPVQVTLEGAIPNEVTFLYAPEANPMDITVHYVDVTGNPLAADTVVTAQPGQNTIYPAAAISPDEYLLVGVPSYEINVTAEGAEMTEVTFIYQPVARPAQVTVHYVDERGWPIAADTVKSLEPGFHQVAPDALFPADEYALIPPEFVNVMVDASGASPDEITFSYQRQVRPVTVTAHYVDDRGETIAQDSVLTYGAGEHIVAPAADIASNLYILREPAAYSLTVDLDTAPRLEVTFTYDRAVQPAAVTVYYTDSEGNPVADATEQVFEGGSFVLFPQPRNLMPDYALPASDPGFRDVTVDVDGAHPDAVTFVYEYRAPAPWVITVQYVDAESGLDVAAAQTVEVPFGAGMSIPAQPENLLPDYTLVDEPAVFVQAEGTEGAHRNVVFRYQYIAPTEAPTAEPTAEPTAAPTAEPTEEPAAEPIPSVVMITVRYLDAAGNPVASDSQVVCAAGDTRILADPLDLQPGYVLQGEDSATVHVDENGASPAEVTFRYAYPESDIAAPKVALVNVKYLSPVGEVFYSYPVTCVEGQENIVTVDPSLVDPALGYRLPVNPRAAVTVDRTGAATPNEVTFQFLGELSDTVTVHCVDMLTGQDVATPWQEVCLAGSTTVIARPADLAPGYTLYGEDSAVVTLSEDGVLSAKDVYFRYVFQNTATPEPLPPAFDTPMDAYFYPTGTSVRVRATPTTAENNIIGSASSGDLGHALGRVVTADNKIWYAVEINGLMGYMSETVVRFLSDMEVAALFGHTLPPTDAPTPVPTAIPDGTIIDRWGTTTTGGLNFRKKPDKSSDRIRQLEKNTRVWIFNSSTVNGDQWYFVRVNGVDGYLMTNYVQMAGEAESAAIQATLASPMPTQVPPATPEPTAAPTEVPTAEPTEAPTPEPTAEPTAAPTAEPTPTATPYRGYALTNGQAALRTGVSKTDDTILEMLPDRSLMIVNGQTEVDSEIWASAQAVSSGSIGFIQQASLIKISAEEARPYLDQIQATPAATATAVPEQTAGYAMTLGDGVPMRNFPDTNGEILMLLPFMSVANVRGQQYTDGNAWHLVQYNGLWGYIRQDQLRMMAPEEVQAYEQTLLAGTPTPSPAPTPEPVTQQSLSSYGHVQSGSGKVNLRSEPTTKNNNAIRLLDNYAFALVLGSVTNDEGTWYHVSQGGNEGYIRSDYFHVLALGELSQFLQSSEYMEANSNNTSTGATSSQIQPVEDYNRTVWQNPALSASYEPFNPFTTPTPDPERLYTATPAPTQAPTAAPTPEIAPVGPQGNVMPEANTQEGASPWPWIFIGAAILCGGGAYGYYVYNQNEKRKRAMREAQARQMRSASVQRPQMRAAQNNPQNPQRPVYPGQRTGAYPPVNQRTGAYPPVNPPANGVNPYPMGRQDSQPFQRQQTQAYHTGKPLDAKAPEQNPTPFQAPNAAFQGKPMSPAGKQHKPETEETPDSEMGGTKRMRRTERNKAKYDGSDQNS